MNTNINKVHFVGAGPGDKELITLKGYKLLSNADVVIYAGSLVNPELLDYCKEGCEIHDSAYMTLEEIINVMEKGIKEGKSVVRLQTGDFSIYGSIREQVEDLAKLDIDYDCTPGVSSFLGASSALLSNLYPFNVINSLSPGPAPTKCTLLMLVFIIFFYSFFA